MKKLKPEEISTLIGTLKARFEKNMPRHEGIAWADVIASLEAKPEKLWSLQEMERTGGEPDVVARDKNSGELTFMDCAAESPKGRRSLCYDRDALNSRKEFKPQNSALDVAEEMGISILSEAEYRSLQQIFPFDLKTSSWILTPPDVRKLGGALFCDQRYNQVFTYHNGAESYYAARGFRGSLRV
jgi:hypothetical protein